MQFSTLPGLVLALVVTATAITAAPHAASAGGWSGGDSWRLTAAFRRGYTLKPLWDRLSDR